jgi:hypothetical protein
MKFLLYAPLISVGLAIGIPFIVAIIYEAVKGAQSYRGSIPHQDIHLPDGEEYKDKVGTPKGDNPSIASQFDGRITNVFKNPWEGIL